MPGINSGRNDKLQLFRQTATRGASVDGATTWRMLPIITSLAGLAHSELEGKKNGEGRVRDRIASSLFNFWLRACQYS